MNVSNVFKKKGQKRVNTLMRYFMYKKGNKMALLYRFYLPGIVGLLYYLVFRVVSSSHPT